MKRVGFVSVGMGAMILTAFLLGSVLAAEPLSKDKFIEIAKAKAVERGYNVDSMNIVYDEGNAMFVKHLRKEGVSEYNKDTKKWKSVEGTTPEQDRPKLKGRNYQAVYFGPRQMMRGGDLWVFIDREMGEVIDSVGGE